MAQAESVAARCRRLFPDLAFELKVMQTSGDKFQAASLTSPGESLPKGLFTKELEVALLDGDAHLAVHSLKDLPTELPGGLALGAVLEREDVRDVLLYRRQKRHRGPKLDPAPGVVVMKGFPVGTGLCDFPDETVLATSSVRRKMQVVAQHRGINVVEIRGNVGTRLRKLAEMEKVDATILAYAGIKRLGHSIVEGELVGDGIPDGLCAQLLETHEMLPAVGQGAIGIEVREDSELAATLCDRLNHTETSLCVRAERQFLRAMGGGCASPVAAHAVINDGRIHLRAVALVDGEMAEANISGPIEGEDELGDLLALQLRE